MLQSDCGAIIFVPAQVVDAHAGDPKPSPP